VNAAELLLALGQRHVTVTREADHLLVEGPASGITKADIASVRSFKVELLRLLATSAAPLSDGAVRWRAEAMRRQVPAYPRPLPLLLARPERPYARGACISCGDVVRAQRCPACIAAAQMVNAERGARVRDDEVARMS
jgi:hypothetical protein